MTSMRNVTDAAHDAKESVVDFGRSAGEKLDGAREDAAGALHTAASSVRATGRQGSAAIGSLAKGAADRLDATASYVEDYDLRDVLSGLRRFGRRHLTATVVLAGAMGFCAGAAINRATHSCAKAREET